MPPAIDTACPTCEKAFRVPAEFAGKTIRCKNCQATFAVPAAGRSAAAKPVKAKPAPDEPAAPLKFADDPPPAAPPKPRGRHDDGSAENDNPYGVTSDALDVPRCPFCANELDPPDTRVCLTCGYDLMDRRRHATKRVYDLTTGDYFKHWLPAIVWVLVSAGALALSIVCWLNMQDWLTGTGIDTGDKNPVTDQPKFYLDPLCFNLFVWVVSAFLIFKGVKFAIKRLVYNWRPAETVKVS